MSKIYYRFYDMNKFLTQLINLIRSESRRDAFQSQFAFHLNDFCSSWSRRCCIYFNYLGFNLSGKRGVLLNWPSLEVD